MDYNNFNHITTYESIFMKLKNTLNEFLENADPTFIKEFYFNPETKNHKNQSNRLITINISPEKLISQLKNSYFTRASITGEIGTVTSNTQYAGIINIALYMVISNRLAKWYKFEIIENPNSDKAQKKLYREKYAHYKSEKNDATIKLLYSLFIYKETVNPNDFLYGHSLESKKKDTLIIDLPKYGQIGVHFGSEDSFKNTKYLARENIKIILEKKLQLGQITEVEFDVLIKKVNADCILPEYSGRFYEQGVPSLPILYYGEDIKKATSTLGLKEKEICEIDETCIKEMCKNNNYNDRELYFLGIKLGFSKSQLELLSQHLKERNRQLLSNSKKRETVDVSSLVKESFTSTTSASRRKVSNHERRCDNNRIVKNNVR